MIRLSPTSRCTITAPSVFGSLYPKAIFNLWSTAWIEASSIILHVDASNTVFEWFIELAEPPDNKVNEMVDIGIGLLFIVDSIDFFISIFFLDAKKIIDRIL